MARTIVGLNDPKAIKKYSAALAVDVARESYFMAKFMSSGAKATTPIQKLTELESTEGEQITYDLNLQMTMAPVEGLSGDKLEGREDELRFATANVYIDITRGGVNAGTRMTRKRTIHNLRDLARGRQKDWWARLFDEQFMMYGVGMRGINDDFLFPVPYTGRANNAFTAPDADHILYGGVATSKATVAATDKLSLGAIDKLVARATMMGGGTQKTPKIQKIRINGKDRFCLLMDPYSQYNLRTDATTGQWLDIQKAAAGAQGASNPIFDGSMGMYNDVILHSHQAVVRSNDYGAGSNVDVAHCLFMGAQHMVCAFGSPGGGLTFDWHEETDDRGNELIVDSHAIFGIRKNSYEIDGTLKDFGGIRVDVASAAV